MAMRHDSEMTRRLSQSHGADVYSRTLVFMCRKRRRYNGCMLTCRAVSAPGTGTLKFPPPSRHQADPSPLFSTKMSPASRNGSLH